MPEDEIISNIRTYDAAVLKANTLIHKGQTYEGQDAIRQAGYLLRYFLYHSLPIERRGDI